MKIFWSGEACDFLPEPATGTVITRLTSTALSNTNIYCEQPYMTPDATKFAVLRSPYADPRMPPAELCVVDVKRYRIGLVEPHVRSILVATAGYTGVLHYLDGDLRVVRFDMNTLEREILFPWTHDEEFIFHSATPDGRYLIGTQYAADFHSEIVRVSLDTGKAEVIHRHPEIMTHVQVCPSTGRDILIQLNRGGSVNDQSESRAYDNPLTGATHFYIDLDGGNVRPLAIGEPYTGSSTGHCAWVADTGRVGLSTAYNWASVNQPGTLDARFPQGNFFTVGPQEEQPIVFNTPNHRFNHVGVSKDGQYFVCDCYAKGVPFNIALVVGNLRTGKHRTLVADCGATGGCAGNSHPHPYISADNRYVVYNSDRTGVGQVYVAWMSDEFRASLE